MGQKLEEELRILLQRQGWKVQAGIDDRALLIERGPNRYVVELKVAPDARVLLLQALLADAYVRARRAARRMNARPLAVVGAPALSDKSARLLQEYATQFLDGAANGVIDGMGRLELRGDGLETMSSATFEPPPPRVRPKPAFDPFSDLNQWMLKVLLAKRFPPELLAAPRLRLRNATQLAHAADVSVPSAIRFVAFLRREGWLARDVRHLELVRVAELLELWQAATAVRPASELRAKWLLRSADPRSQLDTALRRVATSSHQRACVGLFAAAERFGLGHARGILQHVYCSDGLTELVASIDAIPTLEHEGADLSLQRPPNRESIFRGAVDLDGVLVSDILQVWLDVKGYPARGKEQAEYLWRRVIGPNLDRSPP